MFVTASCVPTTRNAGFGIPILRKPEGCTFVGTLYPNDYRINSKQCCLFSGNAKLIKLSRKKSALDLNIYYVVRIVIKIFAERHCYFIIC